MRTDDAIAHFGSVAALANALKINRSAVYQWIYKGGHVPKGRAFELQILTGGVLRANGYDRVAKRA